MKQQTLHHIENRHAGIAHTSINAKNLTQILLGSIALGVIAQIAVPLPFTPVPLTLQTLMISLLTLTLGPRKASLAVFAYLFQGTIGLPVFAGGVANPLWIISPNAGYLIGFALAPLLTGWILSLQTRFSFVKTWLSLSLNEIVILLCGSSGLALAIGLENALYMGFFPFIPGALLKITFATTTFRPIEWMKNQIKAKFRTTF